MIPETVTPAGLRERAKIMRDILDESCARHLELAANEIERLRTFDFAQCSRVQEAQALADCAEGCLNCRNSAYPSDVLRECIKFLRGTCANSSTVRPVCNRCEGKGYITKPHPDGGWYTADCPTCTDSSPEQHSLPGHKETLDALNSLTIRSVTRPNLNSGPDDAN